MRHLHLMTCAPGKADNMPWIKAALIFMQDIFAIVIPLIENKNPQNPVPDPDDSNNSS